MRATKPPPIFVHVRVKRATIVVVVVVSTVNEAKMVLYHCDESFFLQNFSSFRNFCTRKFASDDTGESGRRERCPINIGGRKRGSEIGSSHLLEGGSYYGVSFP